MVGQAKHDCYDKAAELLARRPHFRQELASKLLSRSFSDDEVDLTLDKLTEQGHLDDRRHALDLASGRFQRKGFGPRRIRAELERRGVSSEIASVISETVFPDRDSQVEAGRIVLQKRRLSEELNRQKVARHLERKGYSKSVILQLLEEIRTT